VERALNEAKASIYSEIRKENNINQKFAQCGRVASKIWEIYLINKVRPAV